MHQARAFFFVCAGLLCLAAALLPASAGAQAPAYLTQWGTPGSGDGQFSLPSGVAVDASGNVYVADTDNNRIQKFTGTGIYLTQWGSYGSGDGEFFQPCGVAVDGSGNVFVVDQGYARIQKFTSSGTYLTQWGSFGSEDGQFICPGGVAVDGSGNVYVADYCNNRIQKFTGNGTYLTQWGTPGPWGVAVDGSGSVYVTDAFDYTIQKFTGSGTYLTSWGQYDSGSGFSYYLLGVAVDGSGNVYATECTASDHDDSRIQMFTSSGTYLTQWGTFGSGDGQFGWASGVGFGVAVDGSGDVYVADTENNRIQKFGSAPVAAKSTSWGRIKALYR